MKASLLAWVVYLCVNVVGGTFAILPIDERFLESAIDTEATGAVDINLLTNTVAQNVIGLWYGIAAVILLVLFGYFRRQKDIHVSIPLVATFLWMAFALHFQFAIKANWGWRMLVCYYVATFAVAVVTQILAVQSVEPIIDRARKPPPSGPPLAEEDYSD